MRQVRATILLLLFIATFGRCFAEQYGLIANSALACCVEVVACCEAEHPAHHDEDDPAHHEDEETPDCPVCVLIDNNALVTAAAADLPAPSYALASSFFVLDEWNANLLDPILDHPDPGSGNTPSPPPRLSLSLTELVLFSAPVRGPSMA